MRTHLKLALAKDGQCWWLKQFFFLGSIFTYQKPTQKWQYCGRILWTQFYDVTFEQIECNMRMGFCRGPKRVNASLCCIKFNFKWIVMWWWPAAQFALKFSTVYVHWWSLTISQSGNEIACDQTRTTEHNLEKTLEIKKNEKFDRKKLVPMKCLSGPAVCYIHVFIW